MEIDRVRGADAECPSGLLAGGTPNDLSQRRQMQTQSMFESLE